LALLAFALTQESLHDLMNARRAGLTTSACVVHMPCGKFRARYGVDAFTFVNSQSGTGLQLRGINARIVAGGEVRAGAAVRKVPSP